MRREYVGLGMEEAGLDMKMGTVDVPRVLVLGWYRNAGCREGGGAVEGAGSGGRSLVPSSM